MGKKHGAFISKIRTYVNSGTKWAEATTIAVAGAHKAIDAYLLAMKEGLAYDLICLDVMMPKIDGIRVLKTIRDLERQHQVPEMEASKIIMTTVLGETEIVKSAFDYGCNAYASKPIDMTKMTEVLIKIGFIDKTN